MRTALEAERSRRSAAGGERRRRRLDSPQGVELVLEGRRCLNFCSNDYLGLAAHPALVETLGAAARQHGVGSGASHLVCGHSAPHEALERALAAFTARPASLVFAAGYMCNLGTITALAQRGDAIFLDRLCHASLVDAARLSGAALHRFRHNDSADLSRRLDAGNWRRRLIVVDGVYSMDGDLAPLPELSAVATQHEAWLVVDDAHGIGVLGERGGGSVEHFGLGMAQVPVLIGTLGKALGTAGGFVAGEQALIDHLLQTARPYIYTTAPPPALAAAGQSALTIVREEPQRRRQVLALVRHFRAGASALGLPLGESQTPIQPLVVGDSERAVALSEQLLEAGYWVAAIRPPTVPQGSARLRVALSAAHSEQQVDGLLEALGRLWEAGEDG